MACSNCERLRKEMEETKEAMQLREFELEEKLNHLEDNVEWRNEDIGNLKAELAVAKKQIEEYKALLARLGIEDSTVSRAAETTSAGGAPSLGKASVRRLLEIIRTQSELMEEMKDLIVTGAPDALPS